jgi:UDP-N-acetyl-D-glucosamine dehydrogenase
MEVLKQRGGEIVYHDAYVPSLPSLEMDSVPLQDAVAGADAVVLVTGHPGVDYDAIAREAALFVDLRGVTRGTSAPNVVRL